jgi:ADP-ribosylglycohydrolase
MKVKKDKIKSKIENALWGLFIADAMAMPAHWFYNTNNLKKHLKGEIKGYVSPPLSHDESFMLGSPYNPDIKTAQKFGRSYDILHEHKNYYKTTYSDNSFSLNNENAKIHYHNGLEAGENTLSANLVRLLMQSVIKNCRYNSNFFIIDFINYFMEPGNNRDPYLETYIRKWFENYSKGYPAQSCAETQRNNWSVSSLGGIIRPLVLSLLAENSYQALGLAVEHQNITHRSENISSLLCILVPLVSELLKGNGRKKLLKKYSALIHLPEITGRQLMHLYIKHVGPENIEPDEMWRIHTNFKKENFEIDKFCSQNSEEEIYNNLLSTACYPEHGVPLLLSTAWINDMKFDKSLFSDINAGGDNVHRGMILGLITGAAAGRIPESLKKGLKNYDEIRIEINDFSAIAVSGKGF